MQKNGRYAWEWNHRGHNQLYVDDSALRENGGIRGFVLPKDGDNVAYWLSLFRED